MDRETRGREDVAVAMTNIRAVSDARDRAEGYAPRCVHPRAASSLALLFLAGIATWVILQPPSGVRVPALFACVIAYAIASSVEFEVGPGSIVPTTPVLIVSLFLLPAPIVPLAAIAGSMLASAATHAVTRRPAEDLSITIVSAAHSVGPALVFALANVTAPRLADWPVFVAAAAAQFAVDAAVAWFLTCYRLNVPSMTLWSALRLTHVVDAALLPVGFFIAFSAAGSAVGPLMVLPIVLLLVVLRHDRNQQLNQAIALATRDPLTKLPNRTVFNEQLADRLDPNNSVVLIDLDHFKEVNDTLGHAVGDQLLVEIGQRLRTAVSETDFVARLGGDEFALILRTESIDDALQRTDELLDSIRSAFEVASLSVDVGASAGIAIVNDLSLTPSELLRRADIAMYVAKEDGARRSVYTSVRDHYSPDRLARAGQLRQALNGSELVLYYQPQYDLTSGEIVGAEALLRWNHPVSGLIPPAEFIPIAERTDIITPLTRYVLGAAIAQGAQWWRAGHDLNVSVNISARNLLEDDLVEAISVMLHTHRFPPDALTIELTETSVIANTARATDIMRRLRAIGVRISIDDFGTGQSALTYVVNLPADELKIDRSFISDMSTNPNAAAVVRAIVDLARGLELRVVAEGVESADDVEMLRDNQCPAAQGYHFGRPIPAADFTAMLGPSTSAAVVDHLDTMV